MIKLIAVLCSLTAPYKCHDEVVSAGTSLQHCQVAIRDLPTWAEAFPKYRVAGWKCKMGTAATEKDA